MSAGGEAMSATVVLVEDDPVIGGHVIDGLRRHGYSASWCRSGREALASLVEADVDVVLLDLGLPDLDGVAILRQLRRLRPELLVIILTARTSDIDVVVGLDAGADDYIPKPFELSVLLARLRAHLRRGAGRGSADPAPHQIGGLTVDPVARRCVVGTRELSLRPKEFDLLVALTSRPGSAVSREELMSEVWDENWFGSTKTLDVTIAALRRHLDEAAGGEGLVSVAVPTIRTLRGFGYRLDPPRSS